MMSKALGIAVGVVGGGVKLVEMGRFEIPENCWHDSRYWHRLRVASVRFALR